VAAPKYLVSILFVTGVTGLALAGSLPASAAPVYGFTGLFAPTNWTAQPISSFVNDSGAPNSITLTGPDDGSGNPNTYTYSIALPPNNYAVAFNWSYTSTDSLAAFDQFGYTLNGSPFINLSDPFGGLSQSGSIKLVFNPGDTFSFAMDSLDNIGGPAITQIYNFSAGLPNEIPDCPCVPVPGPLPILGVGAAFGSIRRLRGLSHRMAAFRALSV
jgi:hypothetical protein